LKNIFGLPISGTNIFGIIPEIPNLQWSHQSVNDEYRPVQSVFPTAQGNLSGNNTIGIKLQCPKN